MRTRKHDWFNSETMVPSYGFQVCVNGWWLNAAENGKPLLFDSEADRNQKQAEYRKMKARSNEGEPQ